MSYWNNLNLQIGASPYIQPSVTIHTSGFNNISGMTFERGVTSPYKDSFGYEGEKYFSVSSKKLEQDAKASKTIKELCKKYNIPIKVNIEELGNIKGHLKSSKSLASYILSNLPEEMKTQVNSAVLQEAALLHDYGKVLIPQKILNKEGSLDENEKEIMQLHSTFGYELLKQQGVSKDVLRLIKYHHQTPDGKGYPEIQKDFEYDIASQILRAVDKYTALTEKRCYKEAFTKEKALETISEDVYKEDVGKGYISEEVFEALKEALKNIT